MEKRVLVLKGLSRYDVLRKAADEVVSGFRKRGYTVNILDLVEDRNPQKLMLEIQKGYDFIFSFQALMYDWKAADGTPFISHIKTPLIGWVVDDLIYHCEKTRNLIYDNVYMLTVDNVMVQISKQMYPNSRNIIPLSHGGFDTWRKGVEKDIDVLFPGTIGKKPEWSDFIEDPMPIEQFFADETLKILNNNPQLSVRRALEKVLNQCGEKLDTDLLLELNNVIYYVDEWVRYQCKYRILEALLKNNIHVHIVGDGADELVQQYPDFVTALGSQDITGVMDLMARAKIIINPCPPVFEEGFHERIFTAMLSKAACFTPYSVYVQNKLGTRIEMIDLNNLSKMVSHIGEILSKFDEYSNQILEDNYVYALEKHTWEKRGEQIVDFFEGGCNLDWSVF